MRGCGLVVTLFGLLSGCAHEGVPVTAVSCLPRETYVDYSKEAQAKAFEELTLLPPGSELGNMIADYGKMRAAERACLE